MLTLTNPTINYTFTDISGRRSFHPAWLLAKDMMTRVFDLAKNHDSFFSNGANDKAMTFFKIAEFVRKCDANGADGITIVQDDKLSDPCSWSFTKTSPYYWAFICDEDTATITVSRNLMQVLIKSAVA
jgi:hypothetical protein